MEQFAKETHPISLEQEMRRSYLDYAMSVIVGRALPDVRDGLKPVHRRCLFSMHEVSNDWNKAYKKSARIVGDVMGKYHPHGDTAIYDTIVRMAQDFSLRYPLVDGQGNFGSVDGDNAAAMRYTEIRMAKIAHELLADLDKETVDFGPNYDGSEHEPLVLPSKFPNLLVNGSSGIAVGMATNIPPHNLGEVIDACLHLLKEPETTIAELVKIIPAPDFPTAGIIYGVADVQEGYLTGRGRVVMRARTHVEEMDKGVRQAIVVDELPYQVGGDQLLTKIADLVREKRIEGISDLRNESDKKGTRIVVELKRGEVAEIVLNNLYNLTPMESAFGMNMVALVDGLPKLLNLKQFLDAFLRHRREVVTRRTVFDLRKARDRGHILEGLAVALSNVDEVIAIIKASATPSAAKTELMGRSWRSSLVEEMLQRAAAEQFRPESLPKEFGLTRTGEGTSGYRLSDVQAQRILEMQLQRLTGLEQDKILAEYREVIAAVEDLLDILARPERVTQIIGDELIEVKREFGDPRRSEIVVNGEELQLEDLIAPEDVVVTLSQQGYIKAQPLDEYRSQKRGGRGKQAASTKEDDFIEKLFIANTHDYVLCFSNKGKLYWIKVYEVPQGSRTSRGKPIVNLLKMEDGERINAILSVKEFSEDTYMFFATQQGVVKKTSLSEYSRPRPSGIIAVDLDEGDCLVGVALTDGKHDVMLFSDEGKAVRFDENDVRPMGRGARGVRGMNLAKGGKVIALLVAENEQQSVLTATENGYGKRTPIAEYTRHGRGTQGMIAIQTSERNGKVVAATLAAADDEIMLITSGGVLIRTRVNEIREMGRSTQGVTLINLDEGEKLSGLQTIMDRDDENGENGNGSGNGANGEGEVKAEGKAEGGDGGQDGVAHHIKAASRIFNFGAGPATMPVEVLEKAKWELVNWQEAGMSVMEMSHRGTEFVRIAAEAEADLRKLLGITSRYKVLFLQGGATMQFSGVPMNLLRGKKRADYVNTGQWSTKAIAEAKKFCEVNVAASSEDKNFSYVPRQSTWRLSKDAAYVHVCTNETIGGLEFHWMPDTGEVPLVADMSSHILSRPLDVSRFGLIYAGAQKNIGPAGLVVVIVREDLLGGALPETPNVMNYKLMAEADSMLNTPPTFSVYLAGLTFKWLLERGGLAGIEKLNLRKSKLLYDYIDGQDFYSNPIAKQDRSRMNVPFSLRDASLDAKFLAEAEARGLSQLKGHRSVGGMRASIYNAMPFEGVESLVEFMEEFRKKNG